MAKLGDILRPKSRTPEDELDPEESALVEARIADRVARLLGPGALDQPVPTGSADRAVSDEPPSPDEMGVDTTEEGQPGERHQVVDDAAGDGGPAPEQTPEPAPEPAPDQTRPPIVIEVHRDRVPVMAAAESPRVDVAAAPARGVASDPMGGRLEAPPSDDAASTRPLEGPTPRIRVRRPSAVHAPARRKRSPSAIMPYCPSCATPLRPAPETSRRCERCRQRIVVRHLDGRTVYLAEAVLPVFEAERRRATIAEGLTRERERWLRLAAAVGAPDERVSRLAAAEPSEQTVDRSRTLYLATAERSFRAARRDRRWADAARIRHEHARTLYRAAGSPIPPPDDILRLHRDAVTAELHRVGEVQREAQLIAGACCDVCRADDRRAARVTVELRQHRLPHEGCPTGLCRCRWGLGAGQRKTSGGRSAQGRSAGRHPDQVARPTA